MNDTAHRDAEARIKRGEWLSWKHCYEVGYYYCTVAQNGRLTADDGTLSVVYYKVSVYRHFGTRRERLAFDADITVPVHALPKGLDPFHEQVHMHALYTTIERGLEAMALEQPAIGAVALFRGPFDMEEVFALRPIPCK